MAGLKPATPTSKDADAGRLGRLSRLMKEGESAPVGAAALASVADIAEAPPVAVAPRVPARPVPVAPAPVAATARRSPTIQPAVGQRARAVPNAPGTRTIITSLQVSEAAMDLSRDWQRARLDAGDNVSPAALYEAAFHDLPLNPADAVALVSKFPEAVYAGGRYPTTARLTEPVHEAIKRLTFELRASRCGIPAWRVLAAALARQVAAEGIPVPD